MKGKANAKITKGKKFKIAKMRVQSVASHNVARERHGGVLFLPEGDHSPAIAADRIPRVFLAGHLALPVLHAAFPVLVAARDHLAHRVLVGHFGTVIVRALKALALVRGVRNARMRAIKFMALRVTRAVMMLLAALLLPLMLMTFLKVVMGGTARFRERHGERNMRGSRRARGVWAAGIFPHRAVKRLALARLCNQHQTKKKSF